MRFDLDGTIADRFATLVALPDRALPPDITRLTGIVPTDLIAAPALPDAVGRLAAFVGDACVVGHNVGFDLAFLRAAGLPAPTRVLDTAELASCFVPTAPSYALQRLVAELERPAESRAHRALDDALATALLCCALRRAAAGLLVGTLEGALQLAQPLGEAFVEFVEDAYREKARTALVGERAAATESPSGPWGSAGPRPAPQRAGARSGDGAVSTVRELFAPGGRIAAAFAGFEERPQQVRMAAAVDTTLREGGALVIEAGTGTGKSLAYLVPAIAWARQGRRTVVSTYTTTLQDQLVQKDIPQLLAALGIDCRVAVLKGRANYLCPRRWHLLRLSAATRDEARLALKTLVWRERTETGDRAELNLLGGEQASWARVCAEDEACTASRCAQVRGGCYLERAREAAERAQLVVVNHALLLADARARNRLLPEFRLLIVDEAHHLEDVAAQAFGSRLEAAELRAATGRAARSPLVLEAAERGDADAVALRDAAERARGAIDATFAGLAQLVAPAPQERGYEDRRRITDGLRAGSEWLAVEVAGEALRHDLEAIVGAAEALVASPLAIERGDAALELEAAAGELRAIESAVRHALHEPRQSDICWLAVGVEGGEPPTLHTAPVHAGPLLARYVAGSRDAVVFTSAALAVGESFAFAVDRLGVADRADTLRLGSPFDYRRQALLVLPEGLADPYEPGFVAQVGSIVADVARALGGHTLVLFTAHSMLGAAREEIAAGLAGVDLAVLAQGSGASRRSLLEQFAQTSSVLLGTASFWEGVDLPGDALRCVVLVKLPFLVPDDPLVAGRSEHYDDPFNEYHVPVAALRLKQGFGRLIRRRSDRGAVVLLDRRITQRAYGDVLLSALPSCTVARPDIALVGEAVSGWVDGMGAGIVFGR